MKAGRGIGAVAFGTMLAAVSLAAPSAAVLPPLDGMYAFDQAGAPPTTWSLQSLCIQPNGTRQQSDYTDQTVQTLGCNVLVGSTPSTPIGKPASLLTFGGTTRLTDGMWTRRNEWLEGLPCPDGSTAPLTEIFAFSSPDPAAPNPNLSGTRTTIHDAVCGLQPAMTKAPFTLTYLRPLDAPIVNRYPDKCDYLAGRPSICS